MRYLPHTEAEIKTLLNVIGVSSIDDLFSMIPDQFRHREPLNLPDAKSESEILDTLACLGEKSKPATRQSGRLSFIGGGIYRHHIPTAVDSLSLRGEFATAYTPYQPELSQGTLAAIFEFQTMVCELFGTEFANASMYDGATATVEALLMARRLTKRNKTIIIEGLHPEYIDVCKTYLKGLDGDEETLLTLTLDKEGKVDRNALNKLIDKDVASVVIQNPNFFGIVEELHSITDIAHQAGALCIGVNTEILASAQLKSFGKMGVDIVAGDATGFSTLPTLGGPGVGLLGASGKKTLRAMPGRLVGQTVDTANQKGYVLTLSTREQHIRRDKATSNICTNHGLYALRLAIHLSLLGRTGFKNLATLNFSKSHYAIEELTKLSGVKLKYPGPYFNEFTLELATPAQDVYEKLTQSNISAGIPLSRFYPKHEHSLLVSITEVHQKEDIDRFAQALKEVL